MAKRMPSYFPQGAKLAVRNATMVHGVENGGVTYAELGAPLASGTTIVNAQSIATAGAAITTFESAYTNASEALMGRFGRAIQLVASGATTAVMQVRGRDYLGQSMREDFTLNGTTPVNGKKAFRYIDSITPVTGTGATTINAVTINLFGLPYKFLALDTEFKNQAPAANAGTFVPGLANSTPSTATTNDVRGTYSPATVVPDGVNTFALRYFVDNNNAHGNAQFAA